MSTNLNESSPKPKFLSNQPIGDDLFEGKSQQKIGEVIAGIMKNEKFQIIGIDGAWGTGKSNLVKIVEKKLPDYNFFIYDVWGHQEDDQRKAILVELTEFISTKNIVANKSKWTSKLKKLISKEKEVTTINRPYLSIGFILSLILIVYTPFVSTFVKNDETSSFTLLGKILFILFPVFIIFGIYISKVIYLLYHGSKKQSFAIALQQTFQVYNNKQIDETKTETILENEPSVKDFRKWMKEIEEDLGKQQLVLVFDNFDRLPKRHILSIWSSIHIFFSEEKYRNIKVLIPFDRLHIKNAFKELNSSEEENDYANDYINKTFDLVYRVSQPILSNWKTFFKDKWIEAFTNVNEEEFVKVIQIYEVFRKTITPRDLIAFVNEVVSIKLLDANIPDRYVALFVLNKDLIISNPLEAIIGGNFLKGLSYLYKDDEDFQKYITALVYQIDAKDSLEVAYKKQLKDSLMNNDVKTFIDISKTNVFSKIISSVIDEIDNVENPILVLNELDNESKISEIEKTNVWNNVYIKLTNFSYVDFEIKEAQKIITKHIENTKGENWISKIINRLKMNTDFEPVEFLRLMTECEDYFKKNNISIDINKLLSQSNNKIVEAEPFSKFIQKKKDKYKGYKITTTEQKLNDFFINLDVNTLDKADYIKYLVGDFDLKKFKADLVEKIENDPSNSTALGTYFKRLKEISSKPLEIQLEDEEIHSLFNGISDTEEFYFDLIAMRLARLLDFGDEYIPAFEDILNDDDEQLAKKIGERIEYYIEYGDYLIAAEDFEEYDLYKNVAKKIITNDYGDSIADLNDMLVNFQKICENIDIEPQLFLKDLNLWDSKDFKPEFILKYPLFLYESIKQDESELSKNLLKLVDDYFTSLNKEKWNTIFKDFVGIPFNILKTVEYSHWNTFAIESLRETLIHVIENKSFSHRENWSYLIKSMKSSSLSLTNTFKDIRDKIYSSRDFTNKELFIFLLEEFTQLQILDEKPDESFRTFFKVEFLDDIDLIRLMTAHSDNIKKLFNQSSHESNADFRQGIVDRINTPISTRELAIKLEIEFTDAEIESAE